MLRRGGKNTQKNCTKIDPHDPDNHYGVITDPEPDILECEVKWALESIIMNIYSQLTLKEAYLPQEFGWNS